jgi:hypothetical protein
MNILSLTVRGMLSLGLVLVALHPADSHAAAGTTPFFASYVGQSKLASSGTNSYTIGDTGTGYVTGEGQSTLTADETEHLADAASPCGYAMRGTATLSDTKGATLRLRFTAHTCGFGSDTDATILKAGTFTIVGGTGPFTHAAGNGAMYKLGLFHAPTAIFQFQGTILNVSGLQNDAPGGVPAVAGARCAIYLGRVQCSVPTTNTAKPYTAGRCGNTSISGHYIVKDSLELGFNASGLTVSWIDAQRAAGTFTNSASGRSQPFVLTDALVLHFPTAGGFAAVTTSYSGSGLFPGDTIPGLSPAQVTYNKNGLITLKASPTLAGLCATLR